MKVYIYINKSAAVYLSGLLASSLEYSPGEVRVTYSNQPIQGLDLMVSLTMDQFVYLEENDFLVQSEILLN